VSADRLGGAVDDDVGAELKGALQQWGGEGVVDDAQQVALSGGGAEAWKVGDVQERVGGGTPATGRLRPRMPRVPRPCR
jgi:hypothetical protein